MVSYKINLLFFSFFAMKTKLEKPQEGELYFIVGKWGFLGSPVCSLECQVHCKETGRSAVCTLIINPTPLKKHFTPKCA